MVERSRFPVSVVLRNTVKVLKHPQYAWAISALQVEKELFNYLYPDRAQGVANKIRQVGFRITDVCNLRCHTCGQWGDNGYLLHENMKTLRGREVPAARYKELLHDLKKNGHAPVLYFWGGEPMLYSGLMDVMEEGARLGMPPTIATNASRVPENVDRMIDFKMFLVQISVDGSTAEIHNAARPAMNAGLDNFKTVTKSFEDLYEKRRMKGVGLPLVASLTTLSRENVTDLVNIYERFKKYTDLQIFYLAWWIDAKNAMAHTADFERRFGTPAKLPFGWVGDWKQMDYKLLSRELKELQRRSRADGLAGVHIMPSIVEPEALERYYTQHNDTFGFDQCVSIFQTPEIDSDGSLSPCRDYHDYIVGNVKEQTLTELWNSPRYVAFRQSVQKDGIMPVCTRCCGLMGY